MVLTLWIIAFFGLGVAAINTWVSRAIDNARILKERAEGDLALANAKNEIIYAMGSRPMTYRGLEVGGDIKRPDISDMLGVMSADYASSRFVAFDGRPYVLESNPDYVVQLQDGRGLVNLNFISPELLRRLLALYDAPETLRNQLPDTLADWIDDDDLTRLSGAEKPDYERRNRLLPANAPLLTPREAQNILGWDQVPKLWEDDAKSPLLTTCAVSGFNPNTAPKAVLLAYVPGMTDQSAAAVVEKRMATQFQHARDFMAAADVVVPNEAFFFSVSPGNCVIVDFVNRASNERTRFSLSLIPLSQNQPWQVDYAFKIPSQYRGALDRADPGVTFPAPEALAPEQPGSERIPGVR
ncbi:MAG: type II secretion system minor pseudopilin [Rhodospirillaceae bacterium]